MTPSSCSFYLRFATTNGGATIPRARRPRQRRRDHRPGEVASYAVSQGPPSIDESASPAISGAGRSAAAQSAPCGTGAAVDVCKRAPSSLAKQCALSRLARPRTSGAPDDNAEKARRHDEIVRQSSDEPPSPGAWTDMTDMQGPRLFRGTRSCAADSVAQIGRRAGPSGWTWGGTGLGVLAQLGC